jgi:hypothetical protein
MYMLMKLTATGEDGVSQSFLTEMDMESSNKGGFCTVDSREGLFTVGSCKNTIWNSSYIGDTANLSNPYDISNRRTSGPKKTRVELIKQGLTYKNGDIFFRSGTIRASVNSWTSLISYEDPLRSPQVTLEDDGETLVFYLPQQRPNDDESVNLNSAGETLNQWIGGAARKLLTN